MKDLRLTDAPDRDRDRGKNEGALASFGDGRVDNPVPARFSSLAGGDGEGGKTFFLPGREKDEKDATGVVGGGATADDADDTLDDADRGSHVYEPEDFRAESTAEAYEDDPFGDGDAEKKPREDQDRDDQDASAFGFFDREGVWRLGDWPGGERGADGRWHEGYWTRERFWVAGYWDETGAWREGTRPGGYFDADRGWIPESAETERRRDDDARDARDDRTDRTDRTDWTDRTLGDPRARETRETTTSAADVADALGGLAGLGFGGEARDDSDEMTEIGL